MTGERGRGKGGERPGGHIRCVDREKEPERAQRGTTFGRRGIVQRGSGERSSCNSLADEGQGQQVHLPLDQGKEGNENGRKRVGWDNGIPAIWREVS